MKKINYKSDFDFILRLHDCNGQDVGFPDYDWKAKFWTTIKANAVTASCTGGKCVNCYDDNGQIHVVCNSHNLGVGVLQMEFTAELPNDVYPDGAERVVVPVPVKIELVRAAAPCPSSIEIELMLPFIKGETGAVGEPGPQGPPGITRTPGFVPLISGVKHRRIHLDARPGIFYRNEGGVIRLCGRKRDIGPEGIRINLIGFYAMGHGMRPLESAITDVRTNCWRGVSDGGCDWDFPEPGVLRVIPKDREVMNIFCVCDCLKDRNLITLRRDGDKSVFVAFDGAEPEFRLTAPRANEVVIERRHGNHYFLGVRNATAFVQIRIWRRSSGRKYAWRIQRAGRSGDSFYNVTTTSRTMFLKIRYKSQVGVSDWVYLYCKKDDDGFWRVQPAKMMI